MTDNRCYRPTLGFAVAGGGATLEGRRRYTAVVHPGFPVHDGE